MRKIVFKYKDGILLVIGTMLIILSLCLIFYDKIELLKNNVFDEIELEKYRENNKEESVKENDDATLITDADTDYVEDETGNDNNIIPTVVPKAPSESVQEKIKKEYIGYLEIKKINLKQGLVSKNSYYNNVKYNIQMLQTSDYPDKSLGNVILAAHSGSGYLAFFKNLYKLSLNDEANVYYKNYIYKYKIVNIYNVPKNGKVKVVRDVHKNTLTLITCTYKSKTEQTVYILELVSKVKDGDSK